MPMCRGSVVRLAVSGWLTIQCVVTRLFHPDDGPRVFFRRHIPLFGRAARIFGKGPVHKCLRVTGQL